MKLAKLLTVMVPDYVEDESMFSAMIYLQNPQRNRLEEHLTCCARRVKSEFSVELFPYPAAIKEWLCAEKCPGVYK